jgi:hypothetical protein
MSEHWPQVAVRNDVFHGMREEAKRIGCSNADDYDTFYSLCAAMGLHLNYLARTYYAPEALTRLFGGLVRLINEVPDGDNVEYNKDCLKEMIGRGVTEFCVARGIDRETAKEIAAWVYIGDNFELTAQQTAVPFAERLQRSRAAKIQQAEVAAETAQTIVNSRAARLAIALSLFHHLRDAGVRFRRCGQLIAVPPDEDLQNVDPMTNSPRITFVFGGDQGELSLTITPSHVGWHGYVADRGVPITKFDLRTNDEQALGDWLIGVVAEYEEIDLHEAAIEAAEDESGRTRSIDLAP